MPTIISKLSGLGIFVELYKCTVKPANNDHLWDIGKVVVIQRWSPFRGCLVVMAQTNKKFAQNAYQF